MEEIMQWLSKAGVIDIMRVASSILTSWWFRIIAISYLIYTIYKYFSKSKNDVNEIDYDDNYAITFYDLLLSFCNNDIIMARKYIKKEYFLDSNLSDENLAIARALERLNVIKLYDDDSFDLIISEREFQIISERIKLLNLSK